MKRWNIICIEGIDTGKAIGTVIAYTANAALRAWNRNSGNFYSINVRDATATYISDNISPTAYVMKVQAIAC